MVGVGVGVVDGRDAFGHRLGFGPRHFKQFRMRLLHGFVLLLFHGGEHRFLHAQFKQQGAMGW